MSRGQRGDEEFLFLAEGRPIAPEATLAQMRLITASNSTVRSDFGVLSHNERLRNGLCVPKTLSVLMTRWNRLS